MSYQVLTEKFFAIRNQLEVCENFWAFGRPLGYKRLHGFKVNY